METEYVVLDSYRREWTEDHTKTRYTLHLPWHARLTRGWSLVILNYPH